MTWKIALFASVLIAATLPAASLAAPKERPGGSSTAKSCADKHTTCTNYCVKSKTDVAELNACSRGCDVELLRCDRRARASSTTGVGATTTTAPVTRDPG